jgi:hypothetical protein
MWCGAVSSDIVCVFACCCVLVCWFLCVVSYGSGGSEYLQRIVVVCAVPPHHTRCAAPQPVCGGRCANVLCVWSGGGRRVCGAPTALGMQQQKQWIFFFFFFSLYTKQPKIKQTNVRGV